ncbi:hypothetical protein VMF7928_01945 [Vibrio marisflavi CECT 7928]|uniref:Uncharacterized protein n=1 Tax=Vibrio marisflavi CECT 7928 TaxID=634439 RepID=A0ABN8E7M6_9VIBR|nr:hypothetical protein VMF7928_01945 [Vibrio marisflavi CECT 7928]
MATIGQKPTVAIKPILSVGFYLSIDKIPDLAQNIPRISNDYLLTYRY